MSVNRMRRRHWAELKRAQAYIRDEISLHLLNLELAERRRVCLDAPRKRRVDITVVTRRHHQPDPDNLVGGVKHLVDELRRCRLKKVGRKMLKVETGPGLIWDDDPEWLELEVRWDFETKIYPEGTNYCLVKVYDTL